MPTKNIAVLTSGGDAPGMNALLYALARGCEDNGLTLLGIKEGFLGLCESTSPIQPLSSSLLEPLCFRGGTYLGTSRYPKFIEKSAQEAAVLRLKALEVDRLIVIGGEGSYHGGVALSGLGIPILTLPASIDNDVPGTDLSVGFFSALQSILDALESIKATASAHRRIFLVEVMGNCCGDLARLAAYLGHAICSIVRREELSSPVLQERLRALCSGPRRGGVVCVSEKICDVRALACALEAELGCEIRSTVLGHVQRGSNACAMDLLLAAQLGAFAIERIMISNNILEIIGLNNGQPVVSEAPEKKSKHFPSEKTSTFFSYVNHLIRGESCI